MLYYVSCRQNVTSQTPYFITQFFLNLLHRSSTPWSILSTPRNFHINIFPVDAPGNPLVPLMTAFSRYYTPHMMQHLIWNQWAAFLGAAPRCPSDISNILHAFTQHGVVAPIIMHTLLGSVPSWVYFTVLCNMFSPRNVHNERLYEFLETDRSPLHTDNQSILMQDLYDINIIIAASQNRHLAQNQLFTGSPSFFPDQRFLDYRYTNFATPEHARTREAQDIRLPIVPAGPRITAQEQTWLSHPRLQRLAQSLSPHTRKNIDVMANQWGLNPTYIEYDFLMVPSRRALLNLNFYAAETHDVTIGTEYTPISAMFNNLWGKAYLRNAGLPHRRPIAAFLVSSLPTSYNIALKDTFSVSTPNRLQTVTFCPERRLYDAGWRSPEQRRLLSHLTCNVINMVTATMHFDEVKSTVYHVPPQPQVLQPKMSQPQMSQPKPAEMPSNDATAFNPRFGATHPWSVYDPLENDMIGHVHPLRRALGPIGSPFFALWAYETQFRTERYSHFNIDEIIATFLFPRYIQATQHDVLPDILPGCPVVRQDVTDFTSIISELSNRRYVSSLIKQYSPKQYTTQGQRLANYFVSHSHPFPLFIITKQILLAPHVSKQVQANLSAYVNEYAQAAYGAYSLLRTFAPFVLETQDVAVDLNTDKPPPGQFNFWKEPPLQNYHKKNQTPGPRSTRPLSRCTYDFDWLPQILFRISVELTSSSSLPVPPLAGLTEIMSHINDKDEDDQFHL